VHRAILLDVSAIGHLRLLLVDSLGETAARSLSTQFGFAHRWQLAGSKLVIHVAQIKDRLRGGFSHGVLSMNWQAHDRSPDSSLNAL